MNIADRISAALPIIQGKFDTLVQEVKAAQAAADKAVADKNAALQQLADYTAVVGDVPQLTSDTTALETLANS